MSIDITLDKPSGQYLEGELVSGFVRVHLNKPKKIRSVTLNIKGREKCNWTEYRQKRRNGKTEREKIRYVGKRKLFNASLMLSYEPGEFVLEAGDHEYRFEYRLPNNLPGNMKGTYGEIKYYLKAIVDRPMAFDYTTTMPIMIIPIVDLKSTGISGRKLVYEHRKTVGMCCPSGYINFTLISPKSGYTCLETIPFNIKIDNQSSTDVLETCITIKKYVSFTALRPREKTRKEDAIVTQQKFETQVPAKSGRQNFEVTIPLVSTQPTTLDDAGLIQISYKVKVMCVLGGWHTNISGDAVLIIGSVSLEESGNNQMSVLITQEGQPVEQPMLTPGNKQPSAPSDVEDVNVGWNIPEK